MLWSKRETEGYALVFLFELKQSLKERVLFSISFKQIKQHKVEMRTK
jgi:hypothetical protein